MPNIGKMPSGRGGFRVSGGLVHDRADAAVAPDVLRGFDHVDDRVNRQNHAQNHQVSAHAGHQRERQEVAPHRDARVADRAKHRDETPGDHHRKREDDGAVRRIFHHEKRGH